MTEKPKQHPLDSFCQHLTLRTDPETIRQMTEVYETLRKLHDAFREEQRRAMYHMQRR